MNGRTEGGSLGKGGTPNRPDVGKQLGQEGSTGSRGTGSTEQTYFSASDLLGFRGSSDSDGGRNERGIR